MAAPVHFIVIKKSSKRLVRCGLCQPEMVEAQAQTSGELGVVVTADEMQEAKAELMPPRPAPATEQPPDAMDVLTELLKAKGISVTQEEIEAATSAARRNR